MAYDHQFLRIMYDFPHLKSDALRMREFIRVINYLSIDYIRYHDSFGFGILIERLKVKENETLQYL